ncbi:MAG: TIGR01458 family HAD-type hydrolase [Acidobacteriota bacterium]
MKAILFDLDGVIYNGETLIPGAPEALVWVRQHKIPHLFVTNTTSRGRAGLAEKLTAFGIPVTKDDILTPPIAALDVLRSGGTTALFVPVKTRSEFAGLQLLANDAETNADWVVVGDLGSGWDFATLNRAFRLLKSNPEAKLVALGMTRFWQAADGLRLDAGAYVAALEYATGRPALVMGKPAAAFFHAAIHILNSRLRAPNALDVSDVLMVGDDLIVDVGGAQQAGLAGALVRTGKFRKGDLAHASVKPDYILESVADLPSIWNAESKS